MVRSGLIAKLKNGGKGGIGLLALLVLAGAMVGFSASGNAPAHAAGWLEKVFGDYKPRPRSRARSRVYRVPPKEIRINRFSRRAGSRNAYRIGKMGADRPRKRWKRGANFSLPKGKAARTYRTMCVRTCDGYYFPVSFATGRGGLKKDAQTCRSSCGAPARLYYYPNPGGEIKDMISYRGKKKYQKLKNAFLFKTKFVAACRCRPEPWTEAAKKKHKQYALAESKRKKRLARNSLRKKNRYARRGIRGRKKVNRYRRLSSRNRSRYIRTVGSRRTVRSRSARSVRRAR